MSHLPEKHHGLVLLAQLDIQVGLENLRSLSVLALGSLICEYHCLCGLVSAVPNPTHLLCGFSSTMSKNCCLLAFLSCPPLLNPNSVFPTHDCSQKRIRTTPGRTISGTLHLDPYDQMYWSSHFSSLETLLPNNSTENKPTKLTKWCSIHPDNFIIKNYFHFYLSSLKKKKIQKYFKACVPPGYLIQCIINVCMDEWMSSKNIYWAPTMCPALFEVLGIQFHGEKDKALPFLGIYSHREGR